MKQAKPTAFVRLSDEQPAMVAAYEAFAAAAHAAGPLSERERRLVKLALSFAADSEGATHSHARQALAEGIGVADLRHVAYLAATTLGFPAMMRALGWTGDVAETGESG